MKTVSVNCKGIFFCALFLSTTLISCKREGVPEAGRTIFVRTAGADMPVYLHGNAQSKIVILLLHGGPGGNGLEYRSGTYAEMLEEKYVMAYLDQRGQGASRKVNGSYTVNMQQMIDDVAAVVKVLKFELGSDVQVYLYGHSWGGALGTGFLLSNNHQSQIKGWIESNGAHDLPMLNKDAIPMFIQFAEAEIQRGNGVDKWQEILTWAKGVDVNNISSEDGGKINSYAFEVEALIPEIKNEDNGGIRSRLLFNPVDPIVNKITGNVTNGALNDEVEALAFTNRLSEIKIPTLLLWGKYDFVVPPSLGESALIHLGSSVKSLVMFQHSGHSPMNGEADIYAQAIIDFVEKTK